MPRAGYVPARHVRYLSKAPDGLVEAVIESVATILSF